MKPEYKKRKNEDIQKVTEPPRTNNAVDTVICDVCHQCIKAPDRHQVRETEVRLNEGERYGNDGFGIETLIDICVDCFRNKLIPWVQSQGGVPTKTEWSF